MKTMANAHINEGGALFPFKVFFQGHELFIKANANDTASNLTGSQITHINGLPINNFIEPLLKRTNGDSDTFRRALLERRFAEYVWLYYGESSEFSIKFIKSGVSIADTFKASRTTFNVDDVFEDEFKFEFLDEKNALLTINTFSWGAEYKEVVNFLQNVFQRLQTSSVEHLIIDIRENGGGDDVIWIDGILPYIADKKWRTGGDFRVRMLAGREQDGHKAGDVVDGENSFKDYYPEKEKFKGDVSVLISKFTYSSSILFANVIQDFGFGELVGESTGGMTNQTGGTQAISLKHSKLRAIVPFFYLKRPKGAEDFQTVQPDIEIAYDKTKPYELVDKLIEYRSTKNDVSE